VGGLLKKKKKKKKKKTQGARVKLPLQTRGEGLRVLH